MMMTSSFTLKINPLPSFVLSICLKMEYIIYKGKAKPLEPGVYTIYGKEYYLIGQCQCISPLPHYLLKIQKNCTWSNTQPYNKRKKSARVAMGHMRLVVSEVPLTVTTLSIK